MGFLSNDKEILEEIANLSSQITAQTGKINKMALDLTVLTSDVANTVSVEASAVLLISKLATELTNVANDPVAVANLASQLESASGALSAAIAAVPTTL